MELNVATLTRRLSGRRVSGRSDRADGHHHRRHGQTKTPVHGQMSALWRCVTKITGPQGDVPLGTIPLRFMRRNRGRVQLRIF